MSGVESAFSNNVAVCIGIDDYVEPIPSLETAVADAERMASILRDKHGFDVLPVATNGVTRAWLKALLTEQLPSRLTDQDRFLLYYAGHGVAADGDDGPEGYFVLQDARNDDRTTFQPMTEISTWLNALECKHVLVILDCCFAGAFRWSSTRHVVMSPGPMHRERFERYLEDPAWQVITSSAHNERALDQLDGLVIGERESERDHSPFAEALFTGLSGKADIVPAAIDGQPAGNGVITATELYVYLESALSDALDDEGLRQTARIWPLPKHGRGEFVFENPDREPDLPPAPELDAAANPYRGLDAYDVPEGDEDPLFFGRDELVETLVRSVRRGALTVVVGASGTGKSSVVKAGLLPALRSGGTHELTSPIRPGETPMAALHALSIPGAEDGATLSERVASWTKAHRGRVLVLVIDQFEELITLCRDDSERSAFLAEIEDALTAHPSSLRVIVTIRSDFEPAFSDTAFPGSPELWMRSRVVVPPLSTTELRQVIEGPAAAKVLYFEQRERDGKVEDLVETLIADVLQTPGALPLLSFTLSELYRAYVRQDSDDRCLTFSDYEALGGVGGALRKRADEEFGGLPDDAHRRTMKNVMLRMVSVEGGELARRRVPRAELAYTDEVETRRVETVLGRLSNARLVVTDQNADGTPVAEPAHDALIRGWRRMRGWVNENRERIDLRALMEPAVREDSLWTWNRRLAIAESYKDDWLNAAETRFVSRSRAKRRRWIWSGVAAGIIAALAIGAGIVFGLTQAAETERQTAQRKATASASAYRQAYQRWQENDYTRSIQRLTAAVKTDPSNDRAFYRLSNLLTSRRPAVCLHRHEVGGSMIWKSEHNAASDVFVSFGEDGILRTLDSDTGSLEEISDGIFDFVIEPASGSIVALSEWEIRLFAPDGSPAGTVPEEGVSVLFAGAAGVFAGTSDGRLLRVDLASQSADAILQRERPISMIAAGPTSDRLLVGEGHVEDELGHVVLEVSVAAGTDPVELVSYLADGTSLLGTGPGGVICELYQDEGGLEEEAYDMITFPSYEGGTDGELRDAWRSVSLHYMAGEDVHSVQFSPDGRRLVVFLTDGRMEFVTLPSDGTRYVHVRPDVAGQRSAAFADGTLVMTGDHQGQARLWHDEWGVPIRAPLICGQGNALVDVTFSHDSALLFVASAPTASEDPEWTLSLWSIGGHALHDETIVQPEAPAAHPRLEEVPDEESTWRFTRRDGVEPLDLVVGEPGCGELGDADGLWERSGIIRRSKAIFDPVADRIVSYCGEGPVRVWDARTGTMLLEGADGIFWFRTLFSADGARCVLEGEHPLRTDRFNQKEFTNSLTGIDLLKSEFTFAPRVLSGGGRVDSVELPRGANLLALSRTGRAGLLAIWSSAYEVDLDTLEPTTEMTIELDDRIRGLGYVGNDQLAYSVCRDGTVQVWDTRFGYPVGEPMRFQEPILDRPRANEDDEFRDLPTGSVSPDGRFLWIDQPLTDDDDSPLRRMAWLVAPTMTNVERVKLAELAEKLYGIGTDARGKPRSSPPPTLAELRAEVDALSSLALKDLLGRVLDDAEAGTTTGGGN